MQAKDVMTRNVLTVRQDDSVIDTAKLMLKNRISGMPVVDASGALVGMITEGDLLRRTETQTERRRPRWLQFLLGPGHAAEEFAQTHGRKVGEVMSLRPHCVSDDASLEEVVLLMERHHIKRVPVLREDRLVGIISRANLMDALVSLAKFAPPVAEADREVRDTILSQMAASTWAPSATVNVTVNDGIVDFWGAIVDDRDRKALKVLAENIPGVREVHDHMVWIEPYSGFSIESEEDTAKRERSVA